VSFEGIDFDPKPVAKPYLPIWVAGNSKVAVRRAARMGDGWNPNRISRQQMKEQLEYLQMQPGFKDRPRPFDIFNNLFEEEMNLYTHVASRKPQLVMEKDAILDEVGRLAAIGVTLTEVAAVMGPGTRNGRPVATVESLEEFLERLQWFAEEVLPQGRAITPRSLL
jgi:alkanesulfonate monooxygenase SsuD/methylene tetrahydromethanopterin reductase-like flavin-dependent oxidoreductase (luciferase family)